MLMLMLKFRFVVLLLTKELNELALELSLLKLCCLLKLFFYFGIKPSWCLLPPPFPIPYSLLIVIFLGTTYMIVVYSELLISVRGPVAGSIPPPPTILDMPSFLFWFFGDTWPVLKERLYILKEPMQDLVFLSLRN